ncbi:hypothetical protein ACN47E_009072 [Coniothyrium glycines]
MIEHTCDDAVALDIAPIFDDAVYVSEALGLSATQNEDDLDAQLALLAMESGVHDPYRFLSPPPTHHGSRALSTVTVDSDHRSSISMRSQESQSTGFTSAPSRASGDHAHANASDRPPAASSPRKTARASVSADVPSPSTTTPAQSEPRRSTSTLSVKNSPPSSSSSLQQAPPRRKRAAGLFAMFRRESSACTSRAHHGHHSRSRDTDLACGHALTPSDLRVHIQDALKSGALAAPNCCGRALPRGLLESVLTQQEKDLVLKLASLSSPEYESIPDSGYSENGGSSVDLPQSSNNSPLPTMILDLQKEPVRRTRHQAINVNLVLANEAFTSFKAQQKEQFERISAFECNQRKALHAYQRWSLTRLARQHKASREEHEEQHLEDLETLEEKQISTEHDLRMSQEQETKNIATALKFMEGYCLDTNAENPEHARTVTEDDFKKLDQQRLLQQNLPQKHQNAINVLRAKQERETKRRLEKQEEELEQMDVNYEKEITAAENEHKKQAEELEQTIGRRRRRLLQRWELKFEMWRQDWEEQHNTTLTAPMEHEPWPARKADHANIIADTSSLAPYIRATA